MCWIDDGDSVIDVVTATELRSKWPRVDSLRDKLKLHSCGDSSQNSITQRIAPLLKPGHEPIERFGHRVNLCGLAVQVIGDAALRGEVGEGESK